MATIRGPIRASSSFSRNQYGIDNNDVLSSSPTALDGFFSDNDFLPNSDPPSSPFMLRPNAATTDVDKSFGSSLSLAETPARSSPLNQSKSNAARQGTPIRMLLDSPAPSHSLLRSAHLCQNAPTVTLTPPQPDVDRSFQGNDYFGRVSYGSPKSSSNQPESFSEAHQSQVAERPGLPIQWKSVPNTQTSEPASRPTHKKRPSDCTVQNVMRKKPSRSMLQRESSMVMDNTFCLPSSVQKANCRSNISMDLDSPTSKITGLTASPIMGDVGLADFFECSGSPINTAFDHSALFNEPNVIAGKSRGSFGMSSGSPVQAKTLRATRGFEKSLSSNMTGSLRMGRRPPAIVTNSARQDGQLLSAPGSFQRRPALPAFCGKIPHSAFPILTLPALYSSENEDTNSASSSGMPGPIVMRRHHSVCDPAFLAASASSSSLASSCDDDEDPNDDADSRYAKRNALKISERPDGTHAFRPNHIFSHTNSASHHTNGSHSIDLRSKSMPGPTTPNSSIPGHGANEQDGKILPCHKVKEDGLMRVTASTVAALLDSKLPAATLAKIASVHIIDCRQSYEHKGGHIRTALNLPSQAMAETYFFGGDFKLPPPTTSSESKKSSEGRNIVIVHCEFSLKRGPGVAKHIRSLDRSKNLYPHVHIPELYVLEGGYFNFYKQHPEFCDPRGYTPMNDEDLDKLLARPRHFKRAASWGGMTSANSTSSACAALTEAVFSTKNDSIKRLASKPIAPIQTKLSAEKENIRPDVSPSSFVFPNLSGKENHRILSEEESGAESASGPDSPMILRNISALNGANFQKKTLHGRLSVRAPFSRVQSYSAGQPRHIQVLE